MTTMTDARAVEVLAAMREDGGVVADADWIAAIDRAVSALSQQPEARGVVDGEFAVRLDDYIWRNHGICIGKAAMIRAMSATLTGERNG